MAPIGATLDVKQLGEQQLYEQMVYPGIARDCSARHTSEQFSCLHSQTYQLRVAPWNPLSVFAPKIQAENTVGILSVVVEFTANFCLDNLTDIPL